MFDNASASNVVKLALLESQLFTLEIDRATFIDRYRKPWPPRPGHCVPIISRSRMAAVALHAHGRGMARQDRYLDQKATRAGMTLQNAADTPARVATNIDQASTTLIQR
jgi:hypothetical protein